RELVVPAPVLREREAVVEVARVEARARVVVVEPHAADVASPLEHPHGHCGLTQSVCGCEPGWASPDDDDAEFSPGCHLGKAPAGLAAVVGQRELVLEQR